MNSTPVIEKVKVSELIAQALEDLGIEHIFGIIGAGNVHLYEAIARHGYTEIICVHHEQAAAMSASYYTRTSGRLALCLVTTGAGSSNAITGVLAAWMDGTPLIVISGNEASQTMCADTRVWGVQGYGSAETAEHFTKLAVRGMYPHETMDALERAYKVALKAPQGPVWVDIPKDVQNASL